MSLLIGNKAPMVRGKALAGGNADELHHGNAFRDVSLDDYLGKWVVFFFYTLDFSGVCPTELEEFGKHYGDFQKLNCDVLACSTDSHFSHLAFRQQQPSLKHLPYPLLSDFTHEIAKRYDVLKEETGWALRGLYIIDDVGTVRYMVVHPEIVARSCAETLRVLEALQTGKAVPCDWHHGDKTLD